MKRDQVVKDVRLAGLVSRYHSWPTLNDQSVGEHSWQVARIYHQMFGQPSSLVYTYILYHDAPELATGDPPFPTKSRNPTLKAIYADMEQDALEAMHIIIAPLDPQDALKVKICDLIEMWEFGTHELMMGNQLAQPIIDDTIGVADDMAAEHLSEEDFELYHVYTTRRRQMYG